ncbi:MAG: ligand-binding sensor domain-containing protein, partial [Bacteroidia bacterium]
MKNYIIASFLCFFYLVPSSGVYGQDPYYWKLTDEDGLPSLTVYQVLQDHNGLIWIATANGLCSFDGKFIHNYDCSSLNDLEILKIQEAPDGKIWGLNLSGQLFRADNFEVEVVSSLGNVNLNKVIDFTISGEYLIFGQVNSFTLNSLIRKFNFYRQESSDDTISVKGLLYAIVETNKRIVLYSGIKNDAYLTFLPDCRTFANNYQNCYYNCSSKHLYFKGDTILLPKDNQSIDLIDFSSGIKKGQLRLERNTKSILYVDNYFYFALNQGVVQSDLKHSFSFLPDKTINNVIRDVEGNFFFSTSEGVLIISDFKQVNRRECSSIISSNKVHVLFNDGNRGVIYGTPSGNLSKVVGNQIRSFRETYSSKITSILLPIKKYLIGTDEGLFYLNNKNALIKTAIKCLYLDSEKLVFFGASHAFGWLNPITNKVKVIENLRTYAISETNDGLIWVGSDKGIYTYDRKNFLPYIDNISNSQFPCRVTDMKTSSDGRLWISTLNHGVISVKDKKIEKIYDKSTSLKTNVVHCVAIDSNFVWFGTDRGVYRCNLQTSEVFNINKYFGLPSDEIISLCSSKNVLLIGTSKGLISMPFEAMKLNRVPPNLHLLGIKVNELEQKTSESTFDLNYRQNNLLIEFVSYQ